MRIRLLLCALAVSAAVAGPAAADPIASYDICTEVPLACVDAVAGPEGAAVAVTGCATEACAALSADTDLGDDRGPAGAAHGTACAADTCTSFSGDATRDVAEGEACAGDTCASAAASASDDEVDVAAHARSGRCESVTDYGCSDGAGLRTTSASNPVTASCSLVNNKVTVEISAVMRPPRKVAVYVEATCTIVERNRYRGSVTASSYSSNATATGTVFASDRAARCLTYFVRWDDRTTTTSNYPVRDECQIIID